MNSASWTIFLKFIYLVALIWPLWKYPVFLCVCLLFVCFFDWALAIAHAQKFLLTQWCFLFCIQMFFLIFFFFFFLLSSNVHVSWSTNMKTVLIQREFSVKIDSKVRTSLVAQWLRIRLAMQGTQVRALVREDPTCRKAIKPVCHNYWARVPQLLKPARLEPVQEKSPQWEVHAPQRRVAPTGRS